MDFFIRFIWVVSESQKACHRTLRDQLQLPGNSQMPKMECLPLYAALSPQQQMRIWDSPKPGKRRVILSTNIGKSFIFARFLLTRMLHVVIARRPRTPATT